LYSESFIAQKGIIPINKRCPKETSLPCQTIRTTKAPYIYKKTKILDRKLALLVLDLLTINAVIPKIITGIVQIMPRDGENIKLANFGVFKIMYDKSNST
tara:strand:+ start:690 stop:989 length:300 start_codon:yes stop_codon:yes gene_type:complete